MRRYSCIFRLVCFILLLIISGQGFSIKCQEQKAIIREIIDEVEVSNSTILDIDYSTDLPSHQPTTNDHFEIYTWDKPIVKRVVTVTVVPIRDVEAEEFINQLSFAEMKENSLSLFLNTGCGVKRINADRDKWIVSMSDGKRYSIKQYQMKFTLYIPEYISIDLKSNRSEISLGELTNKASLNLNSVTLKANSIKKLNLDARNSKIHINKLMNGNIEAWYCEFTSEIIGDLTILNSQHSNYEFGNTNHLRIIESKKDEFLIESLFQAEATQSLFSNYYLGDLENSLDISCENGDIFIDRLSPDFENVSINNTFSIIRIGTADVSHLILDTQTKLSQTYLDKEYQLTDEYLETGFSVKKYFKGAENAKSSINIRCKQCEIHLK